MNVSIWQLIVASKKHRQLLVDTLNKTKVSAEATSEEEITSITVTEGTITFSSDDHHCRGMSHNNALYLTLIYLQKHVPLALEDNGLVVNVCPQRTAKRLGIEEDHLSAISIHLRAYENSKSLVLGTFLLPINVDSIERNVEFQVLDIPATSIYF